MSQSRWGDSWTAARKSTFESFKLFRLCEQIEIWDLIEPKRFALRSSKAASYSRSWKMTRRKRVQKYESSSQEKVLWVTIGCWVRPWLLLERSKTGDSQRNCDPSLQEAAIVTAASVSVRLAVMDVCLFLFVVSQERTFFPCCEHTLCSRAFWKRGGRLKRRRSKSHPLGHQTHTREAWEVF